MPYSNLFGSRTERDFDIICEFTAPNSDTQNYPDYRQMTKVSGRFTIYFGNIKNEVSFLREFFRKLFMTFEQHEAREFFKYIDDSGKLVSPFHPHTDAGNARFTGHDIPVDKEYTHA
jgi:hypothetical protein